MAVLINQETGLAEDIPQQSADQFLQAGSHHVPLNDPSGNPITVPLSEAHGLMAQGYSQPSAEQLQNLLDYSKYSSPVEQAKTFAEHAASAATFGLSRGAEAALFKNQEEQRGRSETNPGVGMIGDVTGLGASTLIPGIGEANVLGAAGRAAQEATGLTGLAGRAVQLGVEGAGFQAGDEFGKVFSNSNESIPTALANIGLSALLTPALGLPLEGAGHLWEATVGQKLAPYMAAAKEKLYGTASKEAMDPAVAAILEKHPEIKSVIGDNPTATELHEHLLNSDTHYGRKYKTELDNFRTSMTDEALNSLGYNPSDLSALENRSPYQTGKDLQEKLATTLEKEYAPFEEKFKSIEDKYKEIPLEERPVKSKEFDAFSFNEPTTETPGYNEKENISKQIMELAQREGYAESPKSPQYKLILDTLENVGNWKNVESIRNYSKILRDSTNSSELRRVGGQIRKILDRSREDLVTRALGQTEGAEALAAHSQFNQEYRGLKTVIEDLDSRLRVPDHHGPGTFIESLKKMDPEDVLKRLSDNNDAGLLNLIKEKFPEAGEALRKTLLDNEIKKATNKAGDFVLNNLNANASKMTPEYRQFLFGEAKAELHPPVKEAIGAIETRPEFLKQKFATATPSEFLAARANNKRAAFLSPLTEGDIGNHRLYVTKEGVGFAISPEGDLQNVFNNSTRPGAGKEAILHAIQEGAKTLDAFEGFLPNYYNDFGFNFKNEVKWDNAYAPKDWNYEKYGRPNIVFMEYPESFSRDPEKVAERFGVARSERSSRTAGASGQNPDLEFDPQRGHIDWAKRGELDQDASRAAAGPAPYDRLKEISNTLGDVSTTIKQGKNPSGTAHMSDKLFGQLPWHLGAGALLLHGNPILAGLTEFGGRYFAREVPDAIRMGWLRFLGKENVANPRALKAIIEMGSKVAKGMKAIDKAVKTIVPAIGSVDIADVDESKRKKLEKAAKEFESDPTKFLNVGNDLGTYEPGHAAALGGTLSKALTEINNARPKTTPVNPLDSEIEPNAQEKAHYQRTIENVENPLRVLKRMEQGNLTTQDLQTFNNVYPDMQRVLSQKITAEIINAKSKDIRIPYERRMMLSLFLGQPLDSTMTPQFISQTQSNMGMTQSQQGEVPQGPARGSKKALDKWPGYEMTPGQSRIQNKMKG